jgi:hypothetical protein
MAFENWLHIHLSEILSGDPDYSELGYQRSGEMRWRYGVVGPWV